MSLPPWTCYRSVVRVGLSPADTSEPTDDGVLSVGVAFNSYRRLLPQGSSPEACMSMGRGRCWRLDTSEFKSLEGLFPTPISISPPYLHLGAVSGVEWATRDAVQASTSSPSGSGFLPVRPMHSNCGTQQQHFFTSQLYFQPRPKRHLLGTLLRRCNISKYRVRLQS